MARITADQATSEPWKYTASQYQLALGVHQPSIAEISPIQYASLSKRGKRQYDAKREQEWTASAEVKQAWREAVVAAYDAGRFSLDEATGEAQSAVYGARRDREKAAREARIAEAAQASKITNMDQVSVGDRVFSVMAGRYGHVVKKSRQSARVVFENAPAFMREPVKCNLGDLQWLSYAAMVGAVDSE